MYCIFEWQQNKAFKMKQDVINTSLISLKYFIFYIALTAMPANCDFGAKIMVLIVNAKVTVLPLLLQYVLAIFFF
jgi:hypothetical protein